MRVFRKFHFPHYGNYLKRKTRFLREKNRLNGFQVSIAHSGQAGKKKSFTVVKFAPNNLNLDTTLLRYYTFSKKNLKKKCNTISQSPIT